MNLKKIAYLNIFTLLVLCSGIAIAQNRKAIPSGRYEALSGIKNSRATNNDSRLAYVRSETTNIFWHEVMLEKPKEVTKVDYFTKSNLDDTLLQFFLANAVRQTTNPNSRSTIFYSDDIQRDLAYMKENRSKFLLFAIRDEFSIEKRVEVLKDFELRLFMAADNGYLYLLKTKK